MDDRTKEEIEERMAQRSPALKRSLEEACVQGVDLWWRDMENAKRSKDTYNLKNEFMSIYKEGDYALDLRTGGFDVQMKPYGAKGPDLQISLGGQSIDIEVSRFVRDKAAEEKLRGKEVDGMIDEPWTDDKIYDKIRGKAKQLRDDADGIVLLFSDHGNIGKHDFLKLKEDLADEWIPSEIPAKLSAVIFSDGFIGVNAARYKMLINPYASRARMSAGELERVMEKIMRCLR